MTVPKSPYRKQTTKQPSFNDLGIVAVALKLAAIHKPNSMEALLSLLVAEGLDMSLDTFDKALSRVESHKGQKRILARGRFSVVEPTALGYQLLRTWKPTIEPFIEFLTGAQVGEVVASETITIVSENMFAQSLIPRVIAAFWNSLPETAPTICFDIREATSSTQALEMLRRPGVSAGILTMRGKSDLYIDDNLKVSRPLRTFRDVALIPNDPARFGSLLEKHVEVTLKDLENVPVAFVEPEDVAFDRLTANKSARRIALQSMSAVREMVSLGVAVGIMHDWQGAIGEWEVKPHILPIKISDASLHVRLVERKQRRLSKWGREFLKLLANKVQSEPLVPVNCSV